MYTVLYDHLVVKHDIPKLAEAVNCRIRRAVGQKLATNPALFGLPLRGDLKGFRKLRVGDYRVIFQIRRKTVIVLGIEHRSAVYVAIMKHLGIK